MFKTVKRIIRWCGEFKRKLYIGFLFTFFSHFFAALPVGIAAYTVGMLIEKSKGNADFDNKWIAYSFLIQLALVFFRFLFDYLRARFQEAISYELVSRDRLAIGEALKHVSLGYFKTMNTGIILSSLTTGLSTLETMGIRMVDNFVGGYLNFFVILLFLIGISLKTGLIAILAAAVSLLFLILVSGFSLRNAPVEAKSNKDMTGAFLEYIRGLSVIKSFGQSGVAAKAIKKAVEDSRKIHLKIEWGFIPANGLHLLALKCGSVGIAFASALMCLNGEMTLSMMLMFIFFSFGIFASLEPISDSAHVLSVIRDAMNQIDLLKEKNFIDAGGRDIGLTNFDILFQNVEFGYDERNVLNDVSFYIPEKTSAAIIGASGSGKTTICNLMARFYDVKSGSISIGGHDVREFTCDSLLKNISMVFQNVYLFHDTIRANILFAKPDAGEEEMIEAAKKACCHDFITALPEGYDTVIGEGGNTLSGGEKQRISIARAILKNAPIIILDESTASVDPENEHLIQAGITELTKGKTIISIVHRLATIENSEQILVIDNGKVAQKGTHEELISQRGIYKNYFDIRAQAEGWSII